MKIGLFCGTEPFSPQSTQSSLRSQRVLGGSKTIIFHSLKSSVISESSVISVVKMSKPTTDLRIDVKQKKV